jgi:hypothetical protein
MREGATFDLEDAREAVEAMWREAGEVPRGLLIDMRGVRSETRAAREYFKRPEVAVKTSKVAMLVGSPLSRVIANFFLSFGDHLASTRLFTDEASAVAWLTEPA